MNVEDILTLVKAGYTKTEIESFSQNLSTAAEKPVEVKQPASPAAAEKPEEKPEEKTSENTEVANMLAQMNDTLAKLQAFAIKTDGSASKPVTNDYKDILGSVYGKKEN